MLTGCQKPALIVWWLMDRTYPGGIPSKRVIRIPRAKLEGLFLGKWSAKQRLMKLIWKIWLLIGLISIVKL
jgi:hypothetical protein